MERTVRRIPLHLLEHYRLTLDGHECGTCSVSGYISAFQELCEAFVLSSLVYYIIELLGGEEQLALALRTKDADYGKHSIPFRFVCIEWPMGCPFMMNCKYGVLQYGLVKIVATILVVVLQSVGKLDSGTWAWDSPWYVYCLVPER